MSKPKSQTKKGVEARRWRVNAKEKKRFNTVVTEYVHLKYNDIYNKCCQLYQMLNEKHPEAGNLTKTRTFKRMIEDHNDKSNQVEPDRDDDVVSVETDVADEPVLDEVNDVAGVQADVADEPVLDEVNDVVGVQADVADEPVLDEVNDVVGVQADVADEPVRDEVARAEPDNILSVAIQETLAAHEYGNINEIQNMDNVIDDIINDLEENDAVRAILNDAVDVMAHEMFAEYDEYVPQMDMDEDEGIGLNLEAEIDVEPFDYDLEVEPF